MWPYALVMLDESRSEWIKSGWLVVMHADLYYFPLSLSLSPQWYSGCGRRSQQWCYSERVFWFRIIIASARQRDGEAGRTMEGAKGRGQTAWIINPDILQFSVAVRSVVRRLLLSVFTVADVAVPKPQDRTAADLTKNEMVWWWWWWW